MNTTPVHPRWAGFAAALLLGAAPLLAQKPVLILHAGSGGQPGSSEPAYIRDNFDTGRTIRDLPFDGINVKSDVGNMLMAQKTNHDFTLTELRAAFAPLDDTVDFTSSTFRHNYAILKVHRPGGDAGGTSGDFFDNTGWNAVLLEIKNFAQAVSEVRDPSGNRVFKGILFDNEDYMAPEIWDWPSATSFPYGPSGNGTKTHADYVIQARARFKALYEAIQEGFPGCAVSTPGAEKYGIWVWNDVPESNPNMLKRELTSTSFMGSYEGYLAVGGILLDAGDQFRVTTWNQPPATGNLYTPDAFDRHYKLNLFSFPLGNEPEAPTHLGNPPIVYKSRLLPTSIVPTYPNSVLKSFYVTDRILNETNDNLGAKDAATTTKQLTYALRRVDAEVYYYPQNVDWLGTVQNQDPLVTASQFQPLIAAVAAARATAATRNPGALWYSTGFASASDWTTSGGGTWAISGGAYQKSGDTLGHSRVTGGGAEFPNEPATAGDPLTWTDYDLQGKVKIVSENGSNSMAGLLGRYQNTTNFYAFRLMNVNGTKKWDLSRVRNGTWTSLASANFSWTVGTQYNLKMTFDGRGILCSINGTQVAAELDYTLLSGKAGVIGENGTSTFDDVSVNYIGGGGSGPVYDANDLTFATSSGDTTTVVTTSGSTGGQMLRLNANATGDYLTLDVNVSSAGTYQVDFRTHKNANRGIYQLAIDGVNLGSAHDLYIGSPAFADVAVGTVSLSSGTRAFKFTLTGKNASSGGYELGLDTITLTPVVGAPEANVQGNATNIADGDTSPTTSDHTDFGSANVSAGTVSRTYTLQNTGTAALTVGTVSISGTHASDFSVTAQPASSVAAGSSTTFSVEFDPSAAGTRTAALSFSTDDGDENPYNFSVAGTGTAPAIAFVAAAQANSGSSNVSSLQIAKPAGVASGDYMIAAISIGKTDAGAVTAPTGWTLIRQIDDDLRLVIYRRTAGGSEPANYTWSWNAGTARKAAGGIVAFNGVGSTPIQIEDGTDHATSASTTHTTPSVSTTGSSTWIVSIFGDKNGTGSTWTASGTTERVDTRTTGTNASSVAIYAHGPVAAGSKQQTATASTTSSAAGMEIIALQP